jgi:hypothetical protein
MVGNLTQTLAGFVIHGVVQESLVFIGAHSKRMLCRIAAP